MLPTFAISAVLVALAELGDKTQMLSLALAARYRPGVVLAGVTVAVVALQSIAVVVGSAVGTVLPSAVLAPVTGGLFVGFGVWTLWRSRAVEPEKVAEEPRSVSARIGPLLAVASMFFLAELGDKTQLMTVSLAADPVAASRPVSFLGSVAPGGSAAPGSYIAVWLGTIAGMLLVNGAAIAVGAALGDRLSSTLIARVSGVVFLLFGVLVIVSALMGA